MIGQRFHVRLILPRRAGTPLDSLATVEFAGRITHVTGEPDVQQVRQALFDIEETINHELPHLRVQITEDC